MSFILEALRKSEQERQRNLSPGMADLHARHQTSARRYWLPVVIFLIGINIGLLLFLWINGTPPASESASDTPATPSAAEVAAPAALSAPAVTAPVETAVAENAPAVTAANNVPAELTADFPVQPETTVRDQSERDLSSELAPRAVSRAASPIASPADTLAGTAPSASYSNLPTLAELMLAGTISLSPLHIDMHVFSPQPAERFVFINMKKYREGDSLSEGPVLNTITEDGVILAYQGRSFLVTRE